MGISFSKVVTRTAAAVGLSFLVASCATIKDTPKGPAPDPDATYEHSNRPFSPPIAPKKDGDGKLSPFESVDKDCPIDTAEENRAACLDVE